ncbi:MAG TPA: DUF1254 domain-containing protein [Chroococcales cyanobacterium]|jgi:hypothetical protein
MHHQNLNAEPTKGNANSKEQFEQALLIGTQAYIWGYSLVVLKRTLRKSAARRGTPLNQFAHAKRLATPQSKAVVSPNTDTLYSSAWLDLRQEPIILHVPNTQGRYYSVQFMDAYTNSFAYVGRRVTGTKEGNYAIVGPAWRGILPPNVQAIKSPTNTVWSLVRILVEGEDDSSVARALQQQYTLTSLSKYSGTAPSGQVLPSPLPQANASGSLQFYDELSAAIQVDPPPEDENPLLSLFAQVGIGANRIPSQEIQDQATLDGLKLAILEAERLIDEKVSNLGMMVNGWRVNYQIGTYGKDYLLRAAVAKTGLAANTPEESMHFRAYVDGTDQPLSGANRYVLRFKPGRLPPVDAFWSLTIYGLDGFLVPNPINRYSIGDRTKNLQYNTDGSFDIYIQHQVPVGKESNWLPAPTQGFYLSLRAYQPNAELLTGAYKVPALQRV